MVDSAGKTWMKVKIMDTYTILQPLRSFTPSLSLGGVNAPYMRVRWHVSFDSYEMTASGHEGMRPSAPSRENEKWCPSIGYLSI